MAGLTIWLTDASGGHSTYMGHYQYTLFYVKFGVRPVAYGHKAGVVWTTDKWKTNNCTSATQQENRIDPHGGYVESWMAEIITVANPPVKFWYAIYVEDVKGEKYWNNNRGWNYERII